MEQNPSPEQVKEQITKLEEEVRRLYTQLAALRSQQLIDDLAKTDGPLPRENCTVVRTARGLTVKGSRLTLYSIMDEIKENNSFKNIRDIYELTDEEMLDILDYIHLHSQEVDAEYQEIVRSAEDNRKYWDERNREHFAEASPQREMIRAKLKEWREQYHTGTKA